MIPVYVQRSVAFLELAPGKSGKQGTQIKQDDARTETGFELNKNYFGRENIKSFLFDPHYQRIAGKKNSSIVCKSYIGSCLRDFEFPDHLSFRVKDPHAAWPAAKQISF